jgi:hypothetical protein
MTGGIYDGRHVTEPGNLYGREISSLDDVELDYARQACLENIERVERGEGTCRFGKYRAQPATWAWIRENDPSWFTWLVRRRREGLFMYDREIDRRRRVEPDDDVPF